MNANNNDTDILPSSDDDDVDELALIEAAALHFGSNKNKKSVRDSSKRSGIHPSQQQQQYHQNQPFNNVHSNHINRDDYNFYVGTYTADTSTGGYATADGLKRRHLLRRASAASSTSSNNTVLCGNGNRSFANSSMGMMDPHDCVSSIPTTTEQQQSNPNFNSGEINFLQQDSIGNHQFSSRWRQHQHQFCTLYHHNNQQPNQNNNVVFQNNDDDEDEIEEFSELLPQEYSRINNNINKNNDKSIGYRPSFKQMPIFLNNDNNRASTLSIDSSLMPGTMSGAISRKRRSHTDIADAAAEVAALYRDLSDSEDNFSPYNDEDDCSKTSLNTRGSATKSMTTIHSNTTRRSSGTSTTWFARLSLNHNCYDERPKKRRSSSSSISRLDDPIRMSGRGSMTAFNAASAAVAADEATQRLSEVMHPETSEATNEVSSLHSASSKRRFQRRAGFVVSTIETEAAAALASRTQLIMKDRYESMRAKRPQAARRSMSYSSGARMSSNIIDSCLPEDAESIMENPEVSTDFMKLTRSRMERRLLSLPDQNAVARLSQTSINEDVDFSSGIGHSQSAFSLNLEASTAALRQSYNDRYGHHLNHFQLYNTTSPTCGSSNITNHQYNYIHNQPINTTSSIQNQEQDNLSILSPSLQVAAQVFNTNAIAAQSLAQTAQATIALLQQAQQNASDESTDTPFHDMLNGSGEIDYESYDGKINYVAAIAPDIPEEVRVSELIHEASRCDDGQATEALINDCKEATRMLTADSEEGNVALHVGIKNDSMKVVKAILEKDASCALIRNEYGHTPLHIAVDEGNLAAVIMLCLRSPKSARIQCEEGFLPLHNAVSTGARHADAPQITANLLQTFNEASHISTDEGLLPIHLAAISGFTAGIRTLLSYTFETIGTRELTENMLPLDFAVEGLSEELSNIPKDDNSQKQHSQVDDLDQCTNKDYKSSIELLLSSMLYNRLIPVPRRAGNGCPFMPLHGAAIACPSMESWKVLILMYSEHAHDVDSNGQTVAHVLCSQCKDDMLQQTEVIRMLEKETFFVVDNEGYLPLHRALTNRYISLEFVKEILGRNHEAIAQPILSKSKISNVKFDKFLPVQLAAVHDCDLSIVYELLKAATEFSLYPMTVKESNVK